MEDIFELIAEMVLGVLSDRPYRNPRARTWIITVFFLLLGGALFGYVAWTLWFEIGGILCKVLAAALVAGGTVFLILGHRKNWPKGWV